MDCCGVCFDGARFLALPRAPISRQTLLVAPTTSRPASSSTPAADSRLAAPASTATKPRSASRETGRAAEEQTPEAYYASSGLRKLMLADTSAPKSAPPSSCCRGRPKTCRARLRARRPRASTGNFYPPDMSWAMAAGLGATPFHVASTPAAFLDEGHAHSIKSFPVGPFPRASGSAESHGWGTYTKTAAWPRPRAWPARRRGQEGRSPP